MYFDIINLYFFENVFVFDMKQNLVNIDKKNIREQYKNIFKTFICTVREQNQNYVCFLG